MKPLVRHERRQYRWRTAYKEHGLTVLKEARIHTLGNPLDREVGLKEKYARLEEKTEVVRLVKKVS